MNTIALVKYIIYHIYLKMDRGLYFKSYVLQNFFRWGGFELELTTYWKILQLVTSETQIVKSLYFKVYVFVR